MSFSNFFTGLTASGNPDDYSPVFGEDNGLALTADLSSLSADAEPIVKYVRYSLGEPKIPVELDNNQIYMAFEDANIEYAAYVNKSNALNWLSNLLGLSRDQDMTNKLPHGTFDYLNRLANPYATEAGVGGVYNSRRAYFTVGSNTTDYNLLNDLTDLDTGLSISAYCDSIGAPRIDVRKVWHQESTTIHRYYDPFSSINILDTEFNYESYPNETIFYIMPIYADILRAGMLETSDYVRKSQYSFHIMGDTIRIYPPTINNVRVFVDYTTSFDPFDPDYVASGGDESITGVTGFHNVPVTDIKYADLNSVGKRWVRRYCLATSMTICGRIRRKFSTIPIPNGEVNLDGDALVAEGIELQQQLIEELKEDLEKANNTELMRQDAEMADLIEQQMQRIPINPPFLIMQ